MRRCPGEVVVSSCPPALPHFAPRRTVHELVGQSRRPRRLARARGPPASSGALDDDAEDAKRSAASRADFGWRRGRLDSGSPPRRQSTHPSTRGSSSRKSLTSAPPRRTRPVVRARSHRARSPARGGDTRRANRHPFPRGAASGQTQTRTIRAFEPARRVHLVLVSPSSSSTRRRPPRSSVPVPPPPRAAAHTSRIQTPAPAATPTSDAVLALPGFPHARRILRRDTTVIPHGVELEADMRARRRARGGGSRLRARLDERGGGATAGGAEATRRTADEEEAEARARAWYDAYREVRETCGRGIGRALGEGGWAPRPSLSGASAWT